MRKNPQKKCHRNGNVSTTRLSDNSTNKEQMHHYAHEPGRAVWKWFLSSEHCPQFPLGPRHLSNSNREESSSDGRTHSFFSCCHYLCTLLPTQASASSPPLTYPTLLHQAFSFWQERNYLFGYYFLFIIQNDLHKMYRKQFYVLWVTCVYTFYNEQHQLLLHFEGTVRTELTKNLQVIT